VLWDNPNPHHQSFAAGKPKANSVSDVVPDACPHCDLPYDVFWRTLSDTLRHATQLFPTGMFPAAVLVKYCRCTVL